jgi:uncharacterized membrane protein YfcA
LSSVNDSCPVFGDLSVEGCERAKLDGMGIPGAIELPYTILGFVVGLLVGMTGVGGGSLMTPLLILLFGIHPATAVGTDLLFAAVTKSAGTVIHGLNHTVEWRVTGWLALGSLPATALTLFVLSQVGVQNQVAGGIVKATLVVALLLTSASLLLRRQIVGFAAARFDRINQRRTAALTVATGATLGVLVSLSSIGAGAIGIIALLLLYSRLPIARIVGSDIAHAVPLTFLAGTGHWIMGSLNWLVLISLLTGSLPGIIASSYASTWVPDVVLRPILAITLMIVAGMMII